MDNSKGYLPSNCRWATKTEQSWNRNTPISNTSGFKGVSYHSKSRRWRALITYGGVVYRLGEFKEIDEAIGARLTAEATMI
jgi:hypothetical protein